jgi:hypothetical protein
MPEDGECSTGLIKFVIADGYTFVKFLICKEQHNSWYLPDQNKMAVLQISTLDFVTDRVTDLPTVGPITRAKCYWTTCLESKSDNYLVGSRNPVRHNTVPDHRLIWTSSWSNAVELNHMVLCLWKNTGGFRDARGEVVQKKHILSIQQFMVSGQWRS